MIINHEANLDGGSRSWDYYAFSPIPNSLILADPTMKTCPMFHATLVAPTLSCGVEGAPSARAAAPVRIVDVIIEYTAASPAPPKRHAI